MLTSTADPVRRLGCPARAPCEPAPEDALLECVRCGLRIAPGELFLPAGRCAMGGVVTGPAAGLYEDALEPAGEHLRCAAGARPAREARCWTLGHGTRSQEELVELLREHRVELVADIRTIPRSRHNPQSAGEALAAALPGSGICYLHLAGLGGLRRPRAGSPNEGWRNASFRGYADYMLTAEFAAALAELIELLGARRTAILCAETVYWRCHRSLVADALLVRGIPVLHLLAPGKAASHTLTRPARPRGTQLLYPAGER